MTKKGDSQLRKKWERPNLANQQILSHWAFLTSPIRKWFWSSLTYTFWNWWGTCRLYWSHSLTPNSILMDFFLSYISFLDLYFTTSIVSQMLWNLKIPEKTISYTGCHPAVHGFGAGISIMCPPDCYGLWPLQCYLLTPPLWHYHTSKASQPAMAWVSSFVESIIQTTFIFQLSLCSYPRVDDFTCKMFALIKVACVDTTFRENELFLAVVFHGVICLGLILVSYGCLV